MWKKIYIKLPSVSVTHMSDRYVFCIEGKVQCRRNWCLYTKFSETVCKIWIVKLTHSCTITMKNHMKALNMHYCLHKKKMLHQQQVNLSHHYIF